MRVQQLFDLSGKIAVVTGGGSGLGRQMAEALAECGADVVLCARDGRALRGDGRRARCERSASSALGLAVRRRREAATGRRSRRANRAGPRGHGGHPGEQLGHVLGRLAGGRFRWSGWQKVIDVNLTGAFLFAQAVGRRLHRAAAGREDCQRRLGRRLPRRKAGGDERGRLQREQRRPGRADDEPGGEVGEARDPRERARSRVVPVGDVRAGAGAGGAIFCSSGSRSGASAAPTTSRLGWRSSPPPPPTS